MGEEPDLISRTRLAPSALVKHVSSAGVIVVGSLAGSIPSFLIAAACCGVSSGFAGVFALVADTGMGVLFPISNGFNPNGSTKYR